jgi:cytoskeletal protein CcmA (bactofilin family)
MKTESTYDFRVTDNSHQNVLNPEMILSGNGNMVLDGDLEISGVFSGMIRLNGNLTVGKNARITGDLIVTNLIVYGQIVGTADVSKRASFHDGSRFSGRLTASEADIHERSKVSGTRKIKLSPEESKPRIEPVAARPVQPVTSEFPDINVELVMPRTGTPIFTI